MCPLTPRAAPVAVKSTIASRKRLMFAVSVCFCSSVSFGFVGSSLILGECQCTEIASLSVRAVLLVLLKIDGEWGGGSIHCGVCLSLRESRKIWLVSCP